MIARRRCAKAATLWSWTQVASPSGPRCRRRSFISSTVPSAFCNGVLEVGLGYGTLGQLIASRNADYYGVDIAEGPVANMRRRLSWLGLPEDHAVQASVLALPFGDESFDYVYSIGCLHHTGDLERSV